VRHIERERFQTMTGNNVQYEVEAATSRTSLDSADDHRSRNWFARLSGAISGAVGTVAGITPHVLHHIGPLAGAALLTGTGGSVLFGAIGFVVTVPVLLRLKRRFGSWMAPAIALAIFTAMFTISTLWVGPAVKDALNGGDAGDGSPHSDAHHSAARPIVSLRQV